MSERSLALFKGFFFLVCAAALVAVFLPNMLHVLQRTVVDHGQRPLVMVTTEGGSRDYTMHVKSTVDLTGGYSFVLYFTAPNTVYGDGGNDFEIDAEVNLASDRSSNRLTCDNPGVTTSAVRYDRLSDGAKYLLNVDLISGPDSATNYSEGGNPGATPTPGSSAKVVPFPDHSGIWVQRVSTGIWISKDTENWKGSVGDVAQNNVYAIGCTINRAAVWHIDNSGSTDPMKQSDSTLLAPEFDLTSTHGSTDHQYSISGSLYLARADGVTMQESYPIASTTADGWTFTYGQYWSGLQGDANNYGYTSQISAILANRSAAQSDQNALVWGGIAVGLAASLLVASLSDLIDAGLRRPRREN